MPKPHWVILADTLMTVELVMTTFCNSKKVAKVISSTLGLQKVKKSSISVSVTLGFDAVVLNPV